MSWWTEDEEELGYVNEKLTSYKDVKVGDIIVVDGKFKFKVRKKTSRNILYAYEYPKGYVDEKFKSPKFMVYKANGHVLQKGDLEVGETCPICQEKFKVGDWISMHDKLHPMHTDEVEELNKHGGKCSVCRGEWPTWRFGS